MLYYYCYYSINTSFLLRAFCCFRKPTLLVWLKSSQKAHKEYKTPSELTNVKLSAKSLVCNRANISAAGMAYIEVRAHTHTHGTMKSDQSFPVPILTLPKISWKFAHNFSTPVHWWTDKLKQTHNLLCGWQQEHYICSRTTKVKRFVWFVRRFV